MEARNLGSKLIVQAFILLGSLAREGRVLSHVVRFVIRLFHMCIMNVQDDVLSYWHISFWDTTEIIHCVPYLVLVYQRDMYQIARDNCESWLKFKIIVWIRINHHLSISIRTIGMLSYTVQKYGIKIEKQWAHLMKAEMQGLISNRIMNF